ncbi:MAG: hypothetical protein JXQ75_08395 [Phycisphaerae bacterium]|nr:hypothetical protein [Phycisphaerae bacterium]
MKLPIVARKAEHRPRGLPRRQAVIGVLIVAVFCGSVPGCAEADRPLPRERSRISVIRERPGAARVEGIGPIRGFAKGRDCTFMHCLELMLDATGRKIGYDELMGLSGLAFRTQFRVDGWDVGNADPVVGESCLDALFSAIGWEYEVRVVRRDELAEADALRRAIQQSIDRRRPVLAANIIPPEDWGIITGYQRDRSWLCRSYNGGAETMDRPAKGWPTAVVLLTRSHLRPSAREAHNASIHRAITLFQKQRSDSYAVGDKAFDNWCQSLRSARHRRYIHPNFWTYISLIDARGAVVRYLRSIADEFGPRKVHITTAADWYDKEVRLLLDGLEHVPSDLAFPTSLPPVEMRNRQIDVLRQAQGLERSAIRSLKKAI